MNEDVVGWLVIVDSECEVDCNFVLLVFCVAWTECLKFLQGFFKLNQAASLEFEFEFAIAISTNAALADSGRDRTSKKFMFLLKMKAGDFFFMSQLFSNSKKTGTQFSQHRK